MTQVLRSPPQFPSSASSPISFSSNHDSQTLLTYAQVESGSKERIGGRRQKEEEEEVEEEEEEEEEEEGESTDQKGEVEGQLPVLTFILAVLKKVRCRSSEEVDGRMEIGWPTDVRHVAHVTFDRFHGFLGLPVEFEPEVPRRAPSASAKVFGVSAESMQCSFDYRGNSVPTILLLMQRSLYEQGGLKAEGIFRINGENSQEEYVRDQLNRGVVPDGIDVHCLAGLIKAWFRELPSGVLDSLSPEQVMLCQTEEDCGQLATSLPPTEASLLNWAINLMADVVQVEHENKMNARNVAVVFAPNMTQMADPLTALMYAVQVMNFLKMLILKTLKERQELALVDSKAPTDPPDKNDLQRFELLSQYEQKINQACVSENGTFNQEENSSEDALAVSPSPCREQEELAAQGSSEAASTPRLELAVAAVVFSKTRANSRKNRFGQAKNSSNQKKSLNFSRQPNPKACKPTEKPKGVDSVSRTNSKTERVEAWR